MWRVPTRSSWLVGWSRGDGRRSDDDLAWLVRGNDDERGLMISDDRNAGADRRVSLLLVVEPDAELDAEAGERLARQLRTELAELDIESVSSAAGGTAPDGAKGTDAVTFG